MIDSKQLARALRTFDQFRRDVAELAESELDLAVLEAEAQECLNGLGLALMTEILKRGDTKAPTVTVEGTRWGNRRESKGTYTTVFGDVAVERSTYQRGGGGKLLVPLDLRLGVVEKRYTPKVARILTRTLAATTADEGAALLKEAGVARVSQATLQRVPLAIAARYEKNREMIEASLRENDHVPDAATTIQVSLDGVMVPQDSEHAKPRGRPAPVRRPPRHEQRYGAVVVSDPSSEDDKEGRAWHEACVGTLSYWATDGTHLRTVYLGRMPESGKGTLADQLEDELRIALDARPDLQVVFAADGNPTQWSLLESMSVRLPTDVGEPRYLLDYFHCAKYLHSAANTIHGEGTPSAQVQAHHWGELLREHDDGATQVLKALRYQRSTLAETKRDALDGDIKFLANQAKRGRLNYAQARRDGIPIGTGTVEAAAKTVVNVRMKRAGSRFSQHGGQCIMLFRTAILSGRFGGLSSQLEGTYTANVADAA